MFSLRSSDDQTNQLASSFSRVVQQILEACALHAVEFDAHEQAAFRSSMREIADRFSKVQDHRDLLILAGETSKTIQAYNHLAEKFIRGLSSEKQSIVELMTNSLLRICNSSDKSAQTLRQIERELASASQLQSMRELRHKLSECVGIICSEAAVQEAQYKELKQRIATGGGSVEASDQITGLPTLTGAEARIREIAAGDHQGHIMAFFLKNVEVVNRRFGFSSGDEVLRRFAGFLGDHIKGKDRLFRWRGPCFVAVTDRMASTNELQADASRLALRGPEIQIEKDGKSMLLRLTAATAVYPISKNQSVAELSAKIDQFASEQFKLVPLK